METKQIESFEELLDKLRELGAHKDLVKSVEGFPRYLWGEHNKNRSGHVWHITRMGVNVYTDSPSRAELLGPREHIRLVWISVETELLGKKNILLDDSYNVGLGPRGAVTTFTKRYPLGGESNLKRWHGREDLHEADSPSMAIQEIQMGVGPL